jgi:hypothetical protein
MTDRDAVRAHLKAAYEGWPRGKKDVDEIVERMNELRAENPDGEFPAPTHEYGDPCTECDALRVLYQLELDRDESSEGTRS